MSAILRTGPFAASALGFVALVAILSLLAFLKLDAFCHPRQSLFDQITSGGTYHCVPCDQLPSLAEAERVLLEHQDLVQQIEEVPPSFKDVYVDFRSCPGKGDISITYASRKDRLEIERLIDADTFFGVPYKLTNT